MKNELKLGRPAKEKIYKRDKPFLLKMRMNEYEEIKRLFLISQNKFEADSMTDFIIKSATGKIKIDRCGE